MHTFNQHLTLVGLSLGIIVSFTIFGLVEEKIFRGRFGNETDSVDGQIGEKFRLVYSFDLMQSISLTIIAKILIVATGEPECETSQFYIALAAFFSVLIKLTIRYALGWVPYITQIIGKSCKPLPVMVLGFLIARKRYNLKTVISVISIIVGVIIFNSHQKLDSKETVNDNLLWGNLLIAASLLFDGLLGATEDKMRENSIPSDLSYLYYFNLWGIGLRLLGVLVFNETPKLIDFTTRHPEIIKFFALAILIGDIGQFFANSIILRFGPLPLSVTTTVRKFFSVILSVIIYNNSLQWQQWAAAALILSVMIALSVDAFLNSKKTSTEQHNELEENIETVDNELEKLDKNKKKFSDKNEEFHTGKIWISEYI